VDLASEELAYALVIRCSSKPEKI